jgi:hypothetical protein
MEASVMPRLPLLLTFFKPEASTTAADALGRMSAPRREPISGEFPVINRSYPAVNDRPEVQQPPIMRTSVPILYSAVVEIWRARQDSNL